MSEIADPLDPAGGKSPKPPRDPVRRWTTIVGVVLLLLLALQIASDRTAPVTSIGTVEGLVLPISSRVSGELLRVLVSDNETVEAGTLLAEIDPTPFLLAVETGEADLAQVGQSIGASTAGVAAAQARLAETQAVLTNSQAQAERTLELVKRGVTPAAQGDEARAAVASGEASVAAAEADLRSAEEALGPAGADNPQLRAAQSVLETAQFNLTQTRIVAPTRGRVTNFSLGPGETATAGQPILAMVDLQGGWIVAWYRENQLENIKQGDRADVALDLMPGRVLPARVVSFGGGIDTVNQAAPPGGLVDTPP
jgi:multidrug resistance efflux pump